MLPRNRVFAVRFVSSRDRLVNRLAKSLKNDEKDAADVLTRTEKEQREFFRQVHGKDSAPADEFDVVMTLDYIHDPEIVANTNCRIVL